MLTPLQLNCLIESITASTCSATDTDCVCRNTPLQNNVTTCVLQDCTLKQGLCKS